MGSSYIGKAIRYKVYAYKFILLTTARMKEYPGARVVVPLAALVVEEGVGVELVTGPLEVIVEPLELLDGGAVP